MRSVINLNLDTQKMERMRTGMDEKLEKCISYLKIHWKIIDWLIHMAYVKVKHRTLKEQRMDRKNWECTITKALQYM